MKNKPLVKRADEMLTFLQREGATLACLDIGLWTVNTELVEVAGKSAKLAIAAAMRRHASIPNK